MTAPTWRHRIPEGEDRGTITVGLFDGDDLRTFSIPATHPAFEAILSELNKGEDADTAFILEKVDLTETLHGALTEISDRVGIDGNRILFDGRPIAPVISEAIVEFIRQKKISELHRIVRALERIERNPSASSRENLYSWMENGGLRFDDEGYIIAYKGVLNDEKWGYTSVNQGTATVTFPGKEPEVFHGRIPNTIGAFVTMPRSEVQASAAVACGAGLHFGTQDYAKSWGETTLAVRVDPEFVVAVPHDANRQKVRTCQYTVIEAMDDRDKYTGIAFEPKNPKKKSTKKEKPVSTATLARPVAGLGAVHPGIVPFLVNPEDANLGTGSAQSIELVNGDGETRTQMVKNAVASFKGGAAFFRVTPPAIRAKLPVFRAVPGMVPFLADKSDAFKGTGSSDQIVLVNSSGETRTQMVKNAVASFKNGAAFFA